MTDENQEDVIGDLYEDDNVEEAHDPKNAEKASVDSVKAAGNAVKGKASRGGKGTAKDKENQEKSDLKNSAKDAGSQPTESVRLTKAGMINNAYQKMNSMTKEDLENLYAKVMMEESEDDSEIATEAASEVNADINCLTSSI